MKQTQAMPEHKNDSRRAFASAPINQRTAPRQVVKPPPLPASLQARAQKARQRQLLGPSISELVARRPADPVRQRDKLHLGVIAAAICAVAATSALVLIRTGTGLALAAALGILGGASWLWQHRSRRATGTALSAPAGPPPFDTDALRRIDEAFEATAAIVPEPVLAALAALKAAAVRVALALNGSDINGEFTAEDRMYVIECIRRYIPDTLAAYLQVPAAQRSLPSSMATKTVNDLLQEQLTLLQSELEHREQHLQGSAVEALLRQQRFLESKTTGR